MRISIYCLAAIVFVSSAAAQSPLTTFFASNNGGSAGGAIYFDLTVNAAVTITAFDLNSQSGAGLPGTLSVFTVAGGRAGHLSSQATWTGPSVVGSALTTAATNTPSPCTLQTPLVLPPGVWGIALVANGFGHAYTNGTGTNQSHATPVMQLDAGEADNAPFQGGSFSPRIPNLNIHFSAGSPGALFATKTNYGTGCISSTGASFYESFAAGTIDLGPPGVDNMALLHTGFGYLGFSGAAAYVPPTAAAQALQLSDDSEAQVTLSVPMRVEATGSTTTLYVCSNGFVSTGSNGTGYSPNAATMLSNQHTGWYSWHDYNPGAGGTVWFEELGGLAYVTWDNVPSYGQTQGETFQFQFDPGTGNVFLVWASISGSGNGHLVGYSAGGPSNDPGSIDLSALLPSVVPSIAAFTIDPLQLDVDSRPIVATAMNVTTSNMTASTLFGAVAFGLNQLPTPAGLSGLGMAGCYQYADQLVTLLFFPAGASTYSLPITVPNMVGLNMHAQAFTYDPGNGLTPLGALSSNATHLLMGDW